MPEAPSIDNYIWFKSLFLSAGDSTQTRKIFTPRSAVTRTDIRRLNQISQGCYSACRALGALYLSHIHTAHAMEAIAKYDFKATADDELSSREERF